MSERHPGGIWKTAVSLGLVAVIGTTVLTGVDRLTFARIAEQERRVILEQLGQLIPEDYDNSLLQDRIEFTDETHFPRGQRVTAYRARHGGRPIAVALKFNAVNGYNGEIGLLAGINTGRCGILARPAGQSDGMEASSTSSPARPLPRGPWWRLCKPPLNTSKRTGIIFSNQPAWRPAAAKGNRHHELSQNLH
jgi:hypothetical protein